MIVVDEFNISGVILTNGQMGICCQDCPYIIKVESCGVSWSLMESHGLFMESRGLFVESCGLFVESRPVTIEVRVLSESTSLTMRCQSLMMR
jgi:hypothetical protein